MEIQGRIIASLPLQSGTSKTTGKDWQSQEYVLETHEQYPHKCCFRVFGEDRIKLFDINVGDELTVYLDIDAREYNGRWYNNFNAWSVKRVEKAGNQPIVENLMDESLPFSVDNDSDDLYPF